MLWGFDNEQAGKEVRREARIAFIVGILVTLAFASLCALAFLPVLLR